LLTRAKPYLGGVVPVLNYVNDYRREIAAFFGNSTAATQAAAPNGAGVVKNYIRVAQPVNPEVLAPYQNRLSSSRSNPYLEPGGYLKLVTGLPSFGGYLCPSTPVPSIGTTIAALLQATLKTFYLTSDPGGPPCRAQAALGSLTTGQLQTFPHLRAIP
jgi:hypothetical protein